MIHSPLPRRWQRALAVAAAAPVVAMPCILYARLAASPGASGLIPGRVYSLAVLDDALARQPRAWLQRPLRVYALLGGKCTAMAGLYTPSCAAWELALTDPVGSAEVAPLPLAWGSAPPLLAFLRRLPLLGQVAPPPQILHSSVPAVYRIELQPAACTGMDGPPCYQALLLDARKPDNTTDWVQIGS